MATIHPTAIVEDGASIADTVTIGPFAIIGPEVSLGENVTVHPHAIVAGRTRIGPNTEIFSFAAVGSPPQDLKYKGEPSELIVGANTIIRENVTMNPGTAGGGLVTRVGNHCLFMAGAHVAHDCQVGDHVILVNNAILGGHVIVEDHAIIGGNSAVHQFVRIGKHAMIGGMTGVDHDVIPYGSAMGDRARLGGLNIVGLKRRGFSRDAIHHLRTAYRLLFAEEGTLTERLADVAEMFGDEPAVMEIVEFINSDSSRAVCQPKAEQAA